MQSKLGRDSMQPTKLGGSGPRNHGTCERSRGMRSAGSPPAQSQCERGSGLRWRFANGRVRLTHEIAKEAFTMKKVITGTFAAALFAVAVSAQTPAAGPAASSGPAAAGHEGRPEDGNGHRLSEGGRHARFVHAVRSEVERGQGCGHGGHASRAAGVGDARSSSPARN